MHGCMVCRTCAETAAAFSGTIHATTKPLCVTTSVANILETRGCASVQIKKLLKATRAGKTIRGPPDYEGRVAETFSPAIFQDSRPSTPRFCQRGVSGARPARKKALRVLRYVNVSLCNSRHTMMTTSVVRSVPVC